MPCFHPLKAYRALAADSNGKRPIFFDNVRGSSGFSPIDIPCGQCSGCRLERSRMWAIRCLHEASLYDRNCFVTLTYSDVNLPSCGGLVKWHFQDFVKRLRKKYGSGIRFFACGEYGEQFSRPHYHVCFFNHDFADKLVWSVRDDVPLYTSESLAVLWPFGFSTIGDVTFESAAYVSRYCMKKVTGDKAEGHYMRLNELTGELLPVLPEFTLMSRRPGIGRPWLDKFGADVYPDDFVVVRGRKMKPPRYYDQQFEKFDSIVHAELKRERVKAAKASVDNTPDRLRVREQVAAARLSLLKRGIES